MRQDFGEPLLGAQGLHQCPANAALARMGRDRLGQQFTGKGMMPLTQIGQAERGLDQDIVRGALQGAGEGRDRAIGFTARGL